MAEPAPKQREEREDYAVELLLKHLDREKMWLANYGDDERYRRQREERIGRVRDLEAALVRLRTHSPEEPVGDVNELIDEIVEAAATLYEDRTTKGEYDAARARIQECRKAILDCFFIGQPLTETPDP